MIAAVDTAIFVRTYFGACMECTFCHDSCCQYGADVSDLDEARLRAQANDLEAYIGVRRDEWFTGEYEVESDWPGGRATRTQLRGERCVFLNPRGRGCLLHQYALEKGGDVHEIKPMVCILFPVSWYGSTLAPADEIEDNDMICLTAGPTCYQSARADLAYYFGAELVQELDAVAKKVLAESEVAVAAGGSALALPMVQPNT